MRLTWLLLAAAIALEVTGSLSLKAALSQPSFYVLVVIGYAAALSLLSLVLRRGMGLGVAYGIWAALGVTLTALASAALFGERLTAVTGVGIGLVVAGVLAVELGSQAAHARSVAQLQPQHAGASTEGEP